eukprot:CAMPEP_0176123790 /NCGR_PEP_ID=MMETSP0120_2-20121206/62393_1 /TAXON_ID=160619 /ORGANISM="Kryptoperidinium foliaceum, Strain CCMP 1326" /LENGTH=60 /DNA_ID=CAMNT_0017458519 /DNA_START=94 /DNA_END=273 /DNA_ORIENTATION=+
MAPNAPRSDRGRSKCWGSDLKRHAGFPGAGNMWRTPAGKSGHSGTVQLNRGGDAAGDLLK